MGNYLSTIKRARQSKKHRERNTHYKSLLKTAIKRVLSTTDKKTAEEALGKTVSLLDKLASKRIIHKNKAANQKSRLTLFVNKL